METFETERILLIDLTGSEYKFIPYAPLLKEHIYGRGLVLNLFEKYLPDETGRFEPENLIVLVPGLFAGTPAPSAVRMLVATVESKDGGIHISNTTGNLPQKLGSLGLAAIVIKGKAPQKNTVIHINSQNIDIFSDDALGGITTGEIVQKLKNRYSRNSAIIGTGIAGDKMLSLSSFFCTYPDGIPEYHVPRDGFGDVWGSKNLRAIVVDQEEYFARECVDPERFRKLGRKLAQNIINDEICGSALPALGSMTIMRILEGGNSSAILKSLKGKQPIESPDDYPAKGSREHRNKTCAPMCVIGCLNRHNTNDGRQYLSPTQAETQAAISKCFGIDDFYLAAEVQKKAIEIGIVATEFVTACKTFALTHGIENGEERLLLWLNEIRDGSLTGRLIASRTYGVADLYSDVQLTGWIDRKAIQDEHLFDVRMNTKYPGLPDLNELELLYSQIFILDNLGFCIFTAFALLDKAESFDLMAEMFEAMTGEAMTGEQLIAEANDCINREEAFREHRWMAAQKTIIPPFTRVLYRYFDKRAQDGSRNSEQ